MAMDVDLLAKDIWDLNGEVFDGDGNPLGPTDPLKKYCEGFITMLSAGIVSHLPGTVSGSAAPGSPMTGGSAQGGKVLGLLGPTMAAISATDPLIAAKMLLEANAIATYLMASGLVEFKGGSISGNSTEAANPGPLAAGQGNVGRFTALDGKALAQAVVGAAAIEGPDKEDHYIVMMEHVMDHAEVTYSANTVAGLMSGGVLTVGAGIGGTIK